MSQSEGRGRLADRQKSNLNPDSKAEFPVWKFRIYVVGDAPQSKLALANLDELCRRYLNGRQFHIEVIDLLREPHRYLKDDILVTPTLVRYEPEPVCTLIGNLSNTQEVLLALGLKESRDAE
jgi:circadian clock protein KaiB